MQRREQTLCEQWLRFVNMTIFNRRQHRVLGDQQTITDYIRSGSVPPNTGHVECVALVVRNETEG